MQIGVTAPEGALEGNKTYAEANKGKVRRYQITRRGAKHSRIERIGNQTVFIQYGAKSAALPELRDVIELTPEDANGKYAHMGLVELGRERVEIPATA